MGLRFAFSQRVLGAIMAFGAGVLLSAVAYELTADSVRNTPGTGIPALGFLVGAFVFLGLDIILGKVGAGNRKSIDSAKHNQLVIPMVLAIILDGIPESAVVGIGMLETGHASAAMVVAVFISNLPEAIAATLGAKTNGRPGWAIMSMWLAIVLVCAGTAAAGYGMMGNASEESLSFVKMFAGGAIIMMLANTMIPEAYHHGGKLAGVFTVLGFMISVSVILLEHLGAAA